MDFKNILQALTSLSEGETKETSKGREHKGSYGTSYDGDDDKKEKKPEVKRGRGRPKKDADDSGEVKKYDTKGLHGVFGGGQKPKKEVGNVSKKHSLKEYIEEVEHAKPQLDENVEQRYDRSVDIGQQMANDGITYSPERENEIIGQMAEYMKRSGFSNKEIRYLMNYSEDYIPDQLSYLTKEQGVAEGETIEKKGGRIHKGTYGTSHEAGDEGVKKTPTQRGRGRPKKDSDETGEVKKYDFSAFGTKKGVKLPAWDKSKTTKHSLKEDTTIPESQLYYALGKFLEAGESGVFRSEWQPADAMEVKKVMNLLKQGDVPAAIRRIDDTWPFLDSGALDELFDHWAAKKSKQPFTAWKLIDRVKAQHNMDLDEASDHRKLVGAISSRMKDTPQPQRAPKDQDEADSWARMQRDKEAMAAAYDKKYGKKKTNEAEQIQIKPASQMPKTPGQTQQAAGQTAQNTQVIAQGNKTLGTVNNPQLAQQIKQSIGKGEMTLMPGEEMEEGLGDLARKVGGAVSTGARAIGKAIVGKDDAELLRDLQKKAGMRGMSHGKPSMAHSDVEKVDEVDLGQYDAVKTPLKGKDTSDWDKNFREKLALYTKELDQRQKEKKEKSEKVQEKAPPGAKAERMVKHIKKSYSKDGKLSPNEKSIANATAWKAHNKGKVEESFEYEGMILTEGAMKDLVINLMTDLETGPRGYNINSAVELKDRAMASRIIDKTLAHGERYKRLAGTLKSQLRDAALEEFGFVDYDQSLEEANTDPDFDMPLMDPVVQQKPSIFAKAKPVVQKSTGMLSSLKRPEQSLNPFESKDMKDIQLEGWEQQLNSLLTEGITVTSSTGQQGAPDSVSINATDADAQELLAIVRQAGLGVFGGQEQPTSSYGAPMDPHSAEPSGYGTEPEVSPDVVGDDSDMLALIKKMTGLSTGPEETSDYEDEEGEETTLQPADDEEGEDEPDEETTEGNAFSGAVAKAKADGIQKGEKINVGGKEYPVKEDDVEEGNKFTGNLAKARAAGKKEADLDGDGDMEKVHEGEHTCEACGMQESKCGCEEQVDENFSNDAGGDAMADTELANLKALLAMGNDLHKMKSSNTVGNPTQVSVRESINEWKKLSGIK